LSCGGIGLLLFGFNLFALGGGLFIGYLNGMHGSS
jgi:hypothetical protein